MRFLLLESCLICVFMTWKRGDVKFDQLAYKNGDTVPRREHFWEGFPSSPKLFRPISVKSCLTSKLLPWLVAGATWSGAEGGLMLGLANLIIPAHNHQRITHGSVALMEGKRSDSNSALILSC